MRRFRGDPMWVAFAVSGACGFAIGAFGYATWQVAVESAQVLAGLVHYPRDNAFYMYHTKIWTLCHQIAAALLWSGLSERATSVLLSGVLGMLSFQALALSSFALCGDLVISLGVPFFVEYTRATELWISYPVWLLGASHTYGILGLSAALLTVALLANGAHRTGLAALGLMPAVHPSVGAWLWLLVALAFVSDRRRWLEPLRRAAPAFAFGIAVSAASLAFHLLHTVDVPAVDSATASRYLIAFVRAWDGHRQPISLELPGVRLALGAAALAAAALFVVPSARRPGPSFLLRFVALCGALGVVLIGVSWAPPERIPEKLLILMPNRLMNLNILAATSILVGIAASIRHWTGRAALAGLLGAGVALPQYYGVAYAGPNDSTHPAYHFVLWPEGGLLLGLGLAAGVVLAVATIRHRQPGDRRGRKQPAERHAALSTGLRGAAIAAVLATALVTSARTWAAHPLAPNVFRDWHDDPVLGEVAREPGLLATAADLHLIQLRTRRPVVIDGGGLDFVTYTLEAAPTLDRVLRRLYDIDLFAPPPGAGASGSIPVEHNRAVWESRPREDWVAIGHELGVTGVLVYPDWQLQLPLASRSESFAYYRIPAAP